MRRPRGPRALGVAVLSAAVGLGAGCRAVESPEELQALAGEGQRPRPQEVATAPPPDVDAPAAAAPAVAPAADENLSGFPLVGSVFPGLGGRLHSSLCDPASDPYGTCL